MQKIGFIGLGIMGIPMALNLVRAGFPLNVYARKPDSLKKLIEAGAASYSSPKELAENSDVIITMVTGTQDVEEILLGKKGIVHGAAPHTIVIDMSTISSAATKRIAKQLANKKIDMLDAPVSGGEHGAITGALTIMIGGKKEVMEKVRPIFEALGNLIVHIGDHGAGQIAKSCNQLIVAENILAVSEAFHLAKKAGVDPEKVREALLGGYAGSRVLEIHGKRMLEKDYRPGFKTSLHRKDMELTLSQAEEAGAKLPAAQYAMKCLEQLAEREPEIDSSAMFLLYD